MSFGEFSGYLASLLVFLTFSMKTMIPLRVVAIVSNIAFITYGAAEGLVPILILHITLLPLNFLRLFQLRQMIARTRDSAMGELSLGSLLPYMTRSRHKAGEVLFHEGDDSKEMFYISNGVILLDEIGVTVGRGETLGEMGIFSSDQKRTATARCETDCELLRMSGDKVLQLYQQNPRFGFHLLRVIIRRMAENYTNLKDSMAEMSGSTVAGQEYDASTPVFGSSERGEASIPATPAPWRGWPVLSIMGLLLVAGLLLLAPRIEPYVHSALVRNAVVTARTNIVSSPIQGILEDALPNPGDRIEAGGYSGRLRNPLADNRESNHLTGEVARVASNLTTLESYLSQLEALNEAWRKRTENYAEAFRENLDLNIDSTKRELDAVAERLELAKKSSDRLLQLRQQGAASERDVEEALNQVLQLESNRTSLRRVIEDAEQRRNSSDSNVFLTSEGRSPAWAHITDRLSLEVAQAKKALAETGSRLEEIRVEAQSARELYERRRLGLISVPPENIIWNVSAHSGETISLGTPVLEWISCENLLVDMPVSDASIGLLHPGMRAQIIIEGESKVREGSVLQTRGAAAKLNRKELAAVAKGHDQDSGQVILKLESDASDQDDCPVGRAAWVDIQDLGFMDVIMTRLRLRD